MSVLVCASASLLPLVTRKFHGDRLVAICLIVCYVISLSISLLTGLEIIWPPEKTTV